MRNLTTLSCLETRMDTHELLDDNKAKHKASALHHFILLEYTTADDCELHMRRTPR